jgi:hypothetical protein
LGQAISDLNELYLKGHISPTQVAKLCNLFNFQFANEKFSSLSDNHNFEQALWNRAAFGISTCSNHSERINRTCNEKTANLQNLIECLSKIISVLTKKLSKTKESPNRQAKEQYDYLKKLAETQNIEQSQVGNCQKCQWGFIYSKRYGIQNFPCKHTVLQVEIRYPEKPVFSSTITGTKIIEDEIINNHWQFTHRNNQNMEQHIHIDEMNNFGDFIRENAESYEFLIELTKEILFMKELPATEYNRVLAVTSMEFGIFVNQKSGNDPELRSFIQQNQAIRSEFRIHKWDSL